MDLSNSVTNISKLNKSDHIHLPQDKSFSEDEKKSAIALLTQLSMITRILESFSWM